MTPPQPPSAEEIQNLLHRIERTHADNLAVFEITASGLKKLAKHIRTLEKDCCVMMQTLELADEEPYEESIFTPLSRKEEGYIQKLIENSGISHASDRLFADFGRKVNAIHRQRNQKAISQVSQYPKPL